MGVNIKFCLNLVWVFALAISGQSFAAQYKPTSSLFPSPNRCRVLIPTSRNIDPLLAGLKIPLKPFSGYSPWPRVDGIWMSPDRCMIAVVKFELSADRKTIAAHVIFRSANTGANVAYGVRYLPSNTPAQSHLTLALQPSDLSVQSQFTVRMRLVLDPQTHAKALDIAVLETKFSSKQTTKPVSLLDQFTARFVKGY